MTERALRLMDILAARGGVLVHGGSWQEYSRLVRVAKRLARETGKTIEDVIEFAAELQSEP